VRFEPTRRPEMRQRLSVLPGQIRTRRYYESHNPLWPRSTHRLLLHDPAGRLCERRDAGAVDKSVRCRLRPRFLEAWVELNYRPHAYQAGSYEHEFRLEVLTTRA
jgi:hypothetical protein